MSPGFQLWPAAASQHAREVDLLIGSFGAMVWLLSLPVFLLMGFFAWRYRRGRAANRRHRPNRNIWLETSWSAIPFTLTMVFYVWATGLFLDLQHPPANAMTIDVVAKQWMWKFQHPEGAREINDLHVPVGTPVKLVMTSQDVIHSLYLPAMRIKQDVLPGRYTSEWFTADRTGVFPLRCAEFCGADHAVMGGRLVVMSPARFAEWLAANDGGALSPAERGAKLYRESGCAACHDRAANGLAPSLEGLFGTRVQLADGSVRTADEQYLRDSLILPNSAVTAGYRPIMPSYANTFGPDEIAALVAWMKTSGGSRPQ